MRFGSVLMAALGAPDAVGVVGGNVQMERRRNVPDVPGASASAAGALLRYRQRRSEADGRTPQRHPLSGDA